MRRNLLSFFGLLAALLVAPAAMAQTAKVQIIHNSADLAAGTVDIYLNSGAAPAINDLDFREATPFIDLPAGVLIQIGIAPGTSTGPGDIIANIPATLVANETYVVVANGILPTNLANYDQTANGTNIAFGLSVAAGIDTTASAGNLIAIGAHHGATDVGGVDVLANGTLLIDNIDFSDALSTLEIPAAEFVLQVTPDNNNSTIVTSYYVDLAPLGGQYAYVFASGFLNPANNQNGAAFGLFAALKDGTVIPLTAVGNARAQVVHNAADPGAALVDIYINALSDTIKLDDFAFRAATPFVDLPAGYELDIVIAGPTSTSITDQVVATIPATVMDGETYLIVANGVLDPAQFAANPDGASTAFQLLVEAGVQETGTGSNVDIKVLHGATDAPSVGVNANGAAVVPAASYTNFTGYLSVPAAAYRIDLTAANDPTTLIAPFFVDASGLGGGATLIFASGFLDPAANQNGEAFGLFAAFADGTVAPLTAVGGARAQVVHNSADPAAALVDVYINTLADTIKLDDFAFRAATPFVDLPTEYPIQVVIAGPTSTGIGDQVVATIPATFADGQSYNIVASGLLDPTQFAPNPDGAGVGFALLVSAGAQEVGTGSNVDLRVMHGSTDAPSVGVNANGGAVVPTATYGAFTGYLSVPAAEYRIDVTAANDPATLVAPFYVDASALGGGAGFVFASGFLDPAANQNGEAFGLFVAFADGTVAPLTAVGNARAQVIHNSADLLAATVDVYINALADTIKLDDFAFRTATPFVDLPTGYELDIVIAGPTSTGITDQVVATIPASFLNGESYTVVANGVIDPSAYAANPDGISTAFGLFVADGAQEAAANSGDVDVRVFHGATDAPTVDVLANGGTPPVVSALAYTDFTAGYLGLAPAVYNLGIAPTGTTTPVATFEADVTGLTGGAGVILATGFLDPSANQSGDGFGLLLVLPDGTAILLRNTTSIDKELRNDLLSVFPNPAANQATVAYTIERGGEVTLQVMDMTGRMVINRNLGTQGTGAQSLELDLSRLAAGVHTVILSTETTRSISRVQVIR